MGKTSRLTLILLLCIFNICMAENDANEIIISENLQKMRELSLTLRDHNLVLMKLLTQDTNFKGNPFIALTFEHNTEVNSILHIYILQLNAFDKTLQEQSGKLPVPIPNQTSNDCCWSSISTVHMQLRYSIQLLLQNGIFDTLTYDSPAILLSLKNKIQELQGLVKMWDQYFAVYE